MPRFDVHSIPTSAVLTSTLPIPFVCTVYGTNFVILPEKDWTYGEWTLRCTLWTQGL